MSLAVIRSGLAAPLLRKALYASMEAYGEFNQLVKSNCRLSRATLLVPEHHIMVLDAFSRLAIFYTQSAPESLPFPPPKDRMSFVITRAAVWILKHPANQHLISCRSIAYCCRSGASSVSDNSQSDIRQGQCAIRGGIHIAACR
jgi:hypothetical protein